MKVFVTGVNGQLGHDVVNELAARRIEAVGSDLKPEYAGVQDGTAVTTAPYIPLDITDGTAVESAIQTVHPDAIIHCAAWTAVDAAEDADKKPLVMKVNVDGTRNIAKACRTIDAKMIYISTDYVFSGTGEAPWDEECKDFSPQNVYGESKLGGELAVTELLTKFFIVRTAWVFGLNGANFVKTMLCLADTHLELRVVNDQIGTPTYTPHLARLLVDMVKTTKYGFYHATNEGGYISWADFAKAIFELAGKSVTLTPVTTTEYGVSKAKRPFNSRLSKGKLIQCGFEPLPPWKLALKEYIANINKNSNI